MFKENIYLINMFKLTFITIDIILIYFLEHTLVSNFLLSVAVLFTNMLAFFYFLLLVTLLTNTLLSSILLIISALLANILAFVFLLATSLTCFPSNWHCFSFLPNFYSNNLLT